MKATRLAHRWAGRRTLCDPGPVHQAITERTHEPRHTERTRPRDTRGRTHRHSERNTRGGHTQTGAPETIACVCTETPKARRHTDRHSALGHPVVLAPTRKFKCNPPAGGWIALGGGTDPTQASPTGWTWRLLPKPATLEFSSSLTLGTRIHIHTIARPTSPPRPQPHFPRHFPASLPPAVNLEGLTLPNQTLSVHCRAGTATTSAAQTPRLRVGGAGGEVGQGGRPSPSLLPPPRGACACRRVGKGAEGQQ